jgi:hypothetical protein
MLNLHQGIRFYVMFGERKADWMNMAPGMGNENAKRN